MAELARKYVMNDTCKHCNGLIRKESLCGSWGSWFHAGTGAIACSGTVAAPKSGVR